MVAAPSTGSFANEEDVWFGGGDDREAEARAEQSVAAVGARIIGAKPFPIAARRLEELTRNPKARLEQVVSVLETDPGLSVRLLRLVNSAGYGLKVRVTSVRHAAVLVGTRRLHQVATTAAILDLFETSNDTAVELLEHATVVGSLCRYLAVHLGLPHDELFTCGFLHDIGKLMLLDTEGEKYAELVRNYGGGPDQLHAHERRMFGFDHAILGAHVLTAWNIPEPVPKVVQFHHQPARAMQDSLLAAMVHTLRLADLMSYAVALETDAAVSLVATSEAAQYLEISEPQLAAMWEDIRLLADRSRSRSNGSSTDLEVVAPRRLEVPRSLRPRRTGAPRSLRPDSIRPTPSQGPMSLPVLEDPEPKPKVTAKQTSAPPSTPREVPDHFPCVACSKPSYGNICAACNGQVCPEHQLGADHWCVLCLREYDKFVVKKRIPGYMKVGGLALAGFSVGASITGAMVSQTYSPWKLVVAPLTMLLLWGVLLPVAHRLWLRRVFLNTRPKGRVPLPIKLPRPNEVFISSLDERLESDGLIGASIPPSQGRVSIKTLSVVPAAEPVAELPLPPTETENPPVSLAPGNLRALVTERSPVDPAAPAPSIRVQEASAPSERAVRAIAEIDRANEAEPPAVIIIAPPAAPASPPPTVSLVPSAAVPAAPAAPKSQREPSLGLSEFPSVSTESELESVVASVSARLVRDLPSNDYTGPSADLRAATIAPVSEEPPSSLTMPSRDVPRAAPTPSIQIEPPDGAVNGPEIITASRADSGPHPEPVDAAASKAEAAAPSPEPVREPVAVPAPEPTRAMEPEPTAEPAPVVESAPSLVFPRINLEQGCTPRSAYRCAIPVAESCSPAPGRTSLRTSADFAIGEGPNTLRGLG